MPEKKPKQFSITKHTPLPEIQCSLVELVHNPTQATVLHIANQDEENLFSLSFPTYPSSSNGVAHILEHMVLCGSKKFPVKDPFFSMLRRSLHTFMNAFTGADFTCYPASSQVEKDFYNLLKVYLDAVFYPQLKKQSFLQEGHRLEFFEPENPKTPLLRKGVVYNEMKGALNSPESRLWHLSMEALLPDLPYAYNSGGDPAVIPTLSYEELLSFHKTFYHPSRCLFFFYGNLPLQKHLDFIDEHILRHFSAVPPLPPLQKQNRFTSPLILHSRYPSPPQQKDLESLLVSLSYLTCPLSNQEDVLALSLLDTILMEHDGSPLKLALLKSGLCNQADSYLETELSEVPWFLVCKGCKKGKEQELAPFVQKTLKTIAAKPIESTLIQAALHQLEFARTEITREEGPYGFTLFLRSALAKQHGCAPSQGLKIHSLFESLHKQLKDPQYLPQLIQRYWLQNPHWVQTILTPDSNLTTEEEQKEKEALEALHQKLSPKAKDSIIQETKDLSQYQKQVEHQSLDCLPMIHSSDIPQKLKEYPLSTSSHGPFTVFHHPCFTNQILYVDLVYDLPDLSLEELTLVPLFASFLTEVGCGGRDYRENLELIQRYVGDIQSYLSLHVQVTNSNTCKPSLSISGKALYQHSDKLFQFLHEFSSSADFSDKERIQELLLQHYTEIEQALQSNAMRYAASLATSGISIPSAIYNEWYGLPLFKRLQQFSQKGSKGINSLISSFQHLQKKLLALEGAHLIVTCDQEHFLEIQKQKFFSLSNLSLHAKTLWKGKYSFPPPPSQGRPIPSPVAFTNMALKTVGYEHEHAPALLLAAHLLETLFLHPMIREKGGAYGSGASYSRSNGIFSFHAYRDPQIAHSLLTFRESVENLAKGTFSQEDLEGAKLEAIQSIDHPISPGSRGRLVYSQLRAGKNWKELDQFRRKILSSQREEILAAVTLHLLPLLDQATTVSFGSQELLEKENALLLTHHLSPLPILPL